MKRSSSTSSLLVKTALWVTVGAIVFSTLAPLEERPTTSLPANWERASAFLGLGLFAGFAERKRLSGTAWMLLGFVVLLEIAQHLLPDRHARFSDVMVKAIAALAGLHVGRLIMMLLGRTDKKVTSSARVSLADDH